MMKTLFKIFSILKFVLIPAALFGQVNYYLGMDVHSGTRFRDTMRVDSNAYFMNNLGIGTVSPSFDLDVSGSAQIGTSLAGSLVYNFGTGDNVGGSAINGMVEYYGESLTGMRVIRGIGQLTNVGGSDYDWFATSVDTTADQRQNTITLKAPTTNDIELSVKENTTGRQGAFYMNEDRIGAFVRLATDTLTLRIDSVFDFSANTSGAIVVPRVTTANRPATAVNGMIIYNTTSNAFEFYENGAWVTK